MAVFLNDLQYKLFQFILICENFIEYLNHDRFLFGCIIEYFHTFYFPFFESCLVHNQRAASDVE